MWTVAERNGNLNEESTLDRQMVQGIFNTQVLCAVLDRQPIPEADQPGLSPLFEEAFRLALQGRFKLTPEPPSAAPTRAEFVT